MKKRVSLEAAITVIKFGIAPIACWPLPPDASNANALLHTLWWWFSVIHLTGSLSGWLYNIYVNIHDADLVIRVLSEVGAVVSTIAKMIICRIEAPRLQGLLAEMQKFLDHATSKEMELIQFYVDKCLLSHTMVLISAIAGPFAYIIGPVIISQPLPADTAYPFSIEPTLIFTVLYISQSVIIIQVGCMAILDFMFGILLWYASARFEMLSMELEKVTCDDGVKLCIRRHQELIDFVERLKIPTRVMALEVTTIAVFAVTTGGFVLIRHPSMYSAAKYVFFEFVSGLELFLFAWPADNLIEQSEKVAEAAYRCAWVGKPPNMQKDLMIVMQRSRKPVIISVDGFLPALSLEFYGTTLSASFSYLATLRAMAEN